MLSSWETLDSKTQMFALALVSSLNTLVSGLHPYDWMLGAGYSGILKLADHCLMYRDYFISLNRKRTHGREWKAGKTALCSGNDSYWAESEHPKGLPRSKE